MNPVPVHDAVSLIVLRQGEAAPEVLMGERSARHRFVPGRLVFPGGAVDLEDADALAGSEPLPATTALLRRTASPALARAIAVAAARELEEETGLTLGAPPDLSGLRYLCRAVTPATSPIRFNARFLVIDAGRVRGTLAGSGELERLRWVTLPEATTLDMMLVTREVLQQLTAWIALPDGKRDLGRRLLVFDDRAWRDEADG